MAFGGIETAKFGISIFPTDYAIQPAELAREVEARGLDSMFFPEHTHIPVSRMTPFPGGGDLPRQYWRAHDPFVALATCAAVDGENPARHRHLPRHRARSDHARERDRIA